MFKIKKITTDIPAAPQTIPLTLLRLINTEELRELYPSKHPAMSQWELAFRQMEDVISSNWKNTHPAGAEKVNTGLLSQGREMVPSEADGPKIASGDLLGGIDAARAAENAHTDLQSPKGETTRPEAEGAEIASEGLPGKRRPFPWEGVPITVGEGRQEWERLRSSRAKKGSCRNPLLEETISPDTLKLCAKQCRELDSIPERARTLLLSLLRHASFTFKTGNLVVHPTGSTKDTILLECGWLNKVAMARNIKILCQCGAVEMLMRGAYKINPRYKVLLEESREFIIDTAEPPTQPAPDAGSDKTNEDTSGSQEGQKPLLWDEMKPFMTDEYLASIGESRETHVPANAGSGITDGEDSGDVMTHSDEEASEIASESSSGVPERWLPLLASLRKLAGDGNEVYIGDSEDPLLGFSSKAALYRGLTALRECGAIRALGWGRFLLLDTPAKTPANDVSSEGSARENPAPASLRNDDEPSQSLTETEISKETYEETEHQQPERAGKNPAKEPVPVPGRWKRLYEGLCRKIGDNGLVHTGGSAASELAIECGWNSKSSVFVGLRALCGCGAIEKIENGIYRIASNSANSDNSGDASISNEKSMSSGEIQGPAAPALHEADKEENIPCSGKETGEGEGVPERWKNLMLALSHRAKNGVVKTGGAAADEVMRECGWNNKVSIYEGLRELCFCGALKKLRKGEYQIASSVPDSQQPSGIQVPDEDSAVDKQVSICRFIPNRWRLLFSVLCKKSEGEIVHTSGSAVGEITTKCGWTNQNTVYAGLSALCKCGAISMLEKGRYRINPHTPGLESPPEKRGRDSSGLVPGGGAVALKGSYTSTPQEAAFKQAVIAALRKYRAENGLGCYNTLAKKAGVPVDYIRSMMESGRVSFSYWKNVGKELGVEWGER